MTWTIRQRSEGAGGLSYVADGAGPALMLIHGVGLRAEAWAAMTPLLATRFTVIAVDMPGHGGSRLGHVQTLDSYVDQMQRFAETLEAPIFLAGHSMGAILSMKLAARMGDKVAGMAALNAIFRRSEGAQKAVKQRAAAISAGGAGDNAPTLQRWFGDAPAGALKEAAEACDRWLRTVETEGYARAYSAFARQDGPEEAELSSLRCPALFMTGAGDLNSTPAMSKAMAALAPQGAARTIEDAAHMMPMTHPEQVARAMMQTFLTQTEIT